jgi:hypothetical protein
VPDKSGGDAVVGSATWSRARNQPGARSCLVTKIFAQLPPTSGYLHDVAKTIVAPELQLGVMCGRGSGGVRPTRVGAGSGLV